MKGIRNISLCFVITLIASLSLAGQSLENIDWQGSGPYGGYVKKVVIHPTNPNIMYAATELGGVYKSVNSGNTWFFSFYQAENQNMLSLAIDPKNPEVIYAGNYDGESAIWRSENGGDTWEKIKLLSSTGTDFLADSILHIEVDPFDSDRIFALANLEVNSPPQLLRSLDRGQSWQLVETPGDILNESIILHPKIEGKIFALTRGELFVSFDFGDSWEPIDAISAQIETISNQSLAISPSGDRLYAGVSGGIWISDDEGDSWSFRIVPLTGLATARISDIEVDPNDVDLLYIQTGSFNDAGVYRSANGGISWQKIWPGLSRSLNVNPSKTDEIIIGSCCEDALHISEDNGVNWEVRNKGLANTFVNSLWVDNEDATHLYAGGDRFRINESIDEGRSWSHSFNGIEPRDVIISILSNSLQPNIMYVASNPSGVYKSIDSGENWILFNEGLVGGAPLKAQALSIDHNDPSILYVAISGKGIFRSDNGASTWSLVLSDDDCSSNSMSIAIDPQNSSTIYVAMSGCIFASIDRGLTWEKRDDQANINVVVADPNFVNTLYATGNFSGIKKSVDGGVSWVGTAPALSNIGVIAMIPDHPGSLLAAELACYYCGATKLYLIQAGGDRWSTLDTTGIKKGINVIDIKRGNPSTVYVGTRGQGVFKTSIQFPEVAYSPPPPPPPPSGGGTIGIYLLLLLLIMFAFKYKYMEHKMKIVGTE